MTDDCGIACRDCDQVFLREAIDGTICPSCGTDMDAAEVRFQDLEQASEQRRYDVGRWLFAYLAVVVAAMLVLSALGSLAATENGEFRLPGGIGLGLAVVFSWFGGRGARVALFMLLAFNVYVTVEVARGGIAALAPPPIGVSVVIAAVWASAAVPFLFPQFHHFLDNHRVHRTVS